MMTKRAKTYLLILIVTICYFVLSKIVSYKFASLLTLIFFAIIILKSILFRIKVARISKGVNSVSKDLVYNNNTLTNSYCVVRYIKNEKIIVIDNPKHKDRPILRAFIIDKKIEDNIESCWNDICSMYDTYTYFDSLLSYIDKSSKKVAIIFLDSNEKLKLVSELTDFLPKDEKNKPVIVKPKSNIIKSSLETKGAPIVVNFSDLKVHEVKIPKEVGNPQNVTNLKDLKRGKKIYINYADADTISILPGINIVRAKKIVAHRNIHGMYKTKEDFISVSGVKEHFIKKILEMISLEKYDPELVDDGTANYARIVDYQ